MTNTTLFHTVRAIGGYRLRFSWDGGDKIEARRALGSDTVHYIDVHVTEKTASSFEALVDEWISIYGVNKLVEDIRTKWS